MVSSTLGFTVNIIISIIYICVCVCVYIKGVDKKSGHLQKYSQFGVTVTGRTEINKNRIFLEFLLRDLFKKL